MLLVSWLLALWCWCGARAESAAATSSSSTSTGSDGGGGGGDAESGLFRIEGRVYRPDHDRDVDWFRSAYVTVSGGGGSDDGAGDHDVYGFLRADGSFTVSNLASGSYVVHVTNVRYHYEPLRVYVSGRGRVRARRLSHVQPSSTDILSYPLKLQPAGRVQYFVPREQWRITDVLFSPMVLMMVLPVLLIVVLPRLMSDPETKKEMENLTVPRYDMPDLSELMTSMLGGDKKAVKMKKKN